MQEARGATVKSGKPALVVAGVRGRGAGGADGARAGKDGAPGRGRGRGPPARAVVLDHQVLDAVHRRVEGQVPAAGAGGASSAERVGAEGSAEAAGAQRATPAAAPERARRAPTSEAQGGGHVLSIAAEDLALRTG